MNILTLVNFYWICVSLLTCKSPLASARQGSLTDTTYINATPSPDGTGKFYMGREIAQVMGAGGAAWLERAERGKEEGIAAVLSHLPINAKSIIADIGAGIGYYSFRMARLVPQGKVYAVEVQDEFIEYLNREVKKKAPTLPGTIYSTIGR